jgi:hypothetical protein
MYSFQHVLDHPRSWTVLDHSYMFENSYCAAVLGACGLCKLFLFSVADGSVYEIYDV